MLDVEYGGVVITKAIKREDRTPKIADGWRLLVSLGIIDEAEANREIRALEPPLFMPDMLDVSDADTYVKPDLAAVAHHPAWQRRGCPFTAATNPSLASRFCYKRIQ